MTNQIFGTGSNLPVITHAPDIGAAERRRHL